MAHRLLSSASFALIAGAAFAVLFALWSAGLALAAASTVAWVVVVVALVVVERLAPFEPAWHRPDEQLVNDLTHTALGSALGSRVGVVAADAIVTAIAVVSAGAASTTTLHALWPSSWPLWAQAALAFVTVDGLRYWQHRLTHRVPALWQLHVLHHDPRRLIVIKAGRSHLFDRALQALCVVPVVVAGAGADVVFWAVSLSSIIGLVAHANIDASGCFVFVGPNEHRVHHAKDPALHGSNFGAALTLWDRAFGTFRAADVHDVGLNDDTPDGVVAQLAAPINAWLP